MNRRPTRRGWAILVADLRLHITRVVRSREEMWFRIQHAPKLESSIKVTAERLGVAFSEWRSILGAAPAVGQEVAGRELWPVTAEDGCRYFLKRLGPWRNLPVADEARVLRWLSRHGVEVAEFMITDRAMLFAGAVEDSYVLIPRLASDELSPPEALGAEEAVGGAIAQLHRQLAGYPWSVNSYTERVADALGDLRVPPDVAAAFGERQSAMAEAIDRLPVQLVHGDLTPDNVLLRRPGAVAGFIDFDHLPIAPRVWELGRYLSRRIRRRWQASDPALHRLAHIGPLIAGYQAVTSLTAPELEALPALILACNLIEISYDQQIADGVLERRMLPDHQDVLADTIEATRWQLANLGAVEDAVHSAAS